MRRLCIVILLCLCALWPVLLFADVGNAEAPSATQQEVLGWADTMSKAGGWGVAVLEAAAIIWLVRRSDVRDEKCKTELAAERVKTDAWVDRVIKAIEPKGGA